MNAPSCECLPKTKKSREPVAYYDHLGSGKSISDLKEHFEKKWCISGKEIRFEKIYYTKNKGQTSEGCPLAKSVLRRGGEEEKCLIIVKKRNNHFCQHTWIVVSIVIWEGICETVANDLYDTFVNNIHQFSPPIKPRQKTCTCQGTNPETRGESYSVGCSFSVFHNTCKFSKSEDPDKFRQFNEKVPAIEEKIQNLATNLAPMFKIVAPKSYENQIELEDKGLECRLGYKPGRPWSGVTLCIDYCAHPHTDKNNMENGCTAVVSLTKHRGLEIPDDEQLHVLPHYILDNTDEFGNQKFSDIIFGLESDAMSVKEPFYELVSNSSEALTDNCMGGVGISLSHGSVLYECAKNEVHATTALQQPNRLDPKRISLVLYQHKNMNFRNHGSEEIEEKMAEKRCEKIASTVNKLQVINKFLEEMQQETNIEQRNLLELQQAQENIILKVLVDEEVKARNNRKRNLSEENSERITLNGKEKVRK